MPKLETVKKELSKIPGGTGVVDAEDYKRGRANTLKDALDFAPGVFIQPRFGAEESRLSIRGSGLQRTFHGRGIKLLQDGVPLNLADGSFDFQAVEPLSSRYIEIYRGANSLQYGATTLGGAINFVTMTGYDASRMLARFEVGSFDSIRAQISSGMVLGNTDYYFSVTHSAAQGYRDWSEQRNQRVFANIGQKLGDDLETRFYLTYVQSVSELPGGLTRDEFQENPERPNTASHIQKQKRDFQLFRLANKTTYVNGDHTLSLSAFWSWKDLDHPIFQVIDQLSNDLGVNISYENKAQFLGHQNEFILGFAPVYGITQDQRFPNINGQRGRQSADYELEAINLDFYFQNRFYLTETLSLVAGAQVTYASRDLTEERLFPASGNSVNNTNRQKYWGFSPRLGMLWDVTPDQQVFINFGRSFEPPSFGELVPFGNSLLTLDAQTATTAEIGTRGTYGRLSWDVAYYYAWVKNELLALGVPGGPTMTTNAENTIHQGIELSLQADLIRGIFSKEQERANQDRLMFRQMYLWNNFRFDNDRSFGDNQLPGVPAHFYRAELMYEHPSGFYLGPNLEWTFQSYPVDLSNTRDAGSFVIFGLKAGYRTSKGISFYIEAKNLADQPYVATTGVIQSATALAPRARNYFFPGDGRAFYAGIEWKW